MNIFVDQPELQNVVLDFPQYALTISNIILNSSPQFNVGIFGEWGTGKTTLMKNIRAILVAENIRTMEFNAWRYEGEERSATYPLMLTILGNLLTNTEIQSQLEKKPTETKEKITTKIKRVLKGLSGSVTVGLPGMLETTVSVDPSRMERTEKLKIEEMFDFYDENKPVLQEGVELIELLLQLSPKNPRNPELSLVVFIDDLDRCTPEKAAEVFESIKVFFDLRGLVFVLGLSLSVVEAAIDVKYKDFTQKTFSGSDYLKKIIQVPFTLPPWTKDDISKYLDALLVAQTNSQLKEFFIKHKEIILQAVVTNPREVKRLLNNFIMINGIYEHDPNVKDDILLVLQALSMRWRWLHELIITDTKNVNELSKLFNLVNTNVNQNMVIPIDGNENPTSLDESIVKRLKGDKDLISFLKGYGNVIFGISENDWKRYGRATSIETNVDQLKSKTTFTINEDSWAYRTMQEELLQLRLKEEQRRLEEEKRIKEEQRRLVEEKKIKEEERRIEEENQKRWGVSGKTLEQLIADEAKGVFSKSSLKDVGLRTHLANLARRREEDRKMIENAQKQQRRPRSK